MIGAPFIGSTLFFLLLHGRNWLGPMPFQSWSNQDNSLEPSSTVTIDSTPDIHPIPHCIVMSTTLSTYHHGDCHDVHSFHPSWLDEPFPWSFIVPSRYLLYWLSRSWSFKRQLNRDILECHQWFNTGLTFKIPSWWLTTMSRHSATLDLMNHSPFCSSFRQVA